LTILIRQLSGAQHLSVPASLCLSAESVEVHQIDTLSIVKPTGDRHVVLPIAHNSGGISVGTGPEQTIKLAEPALNHSQGVVLSTDDRQPSVC
jgi:hypothetical protein